MIRSTLQKILSKNKKSVTSDHTDSFEERKLDTLTEYVRQYCAKHNMNETDVAYELCSLFLNKQKNIIDILNKEQLGFKHPFFQDIAKRINEMDHFMDKPFEVVEGVNQCGNGKCNSTRTLSYCRQTRSGDEGMTVYVFCIDCKFRYTMNS
jgi:DNA-directed RNA polymerase subunit M/transcription elongation factor TFIIS